jgi:hypothetical protein
MKRIFIICLLLLSLTLCALPVSAEGEFENMQALWNHWTSTADSDALSFYPEGVCGVWCYGDMSRVTIMITKDEAGTAAKEQILSSLKNSAGVDFTYGSYTYLELRQIQEELNVKAQNGELADVGLCWWGVSEQNNRLEIGINTENPNAADFILQMFDKYQNRIAFEHCSGVFTTYVESTQPTTSMLVYDATAELNNKIVFRGRPGMAIPGGTIATPDVAEPSYDWLWLVGILTAVSLAGTAMLGVRRANASVAVLSNGETVTAADADIKTLVRDAAVTPSSELDSKILDAVKNTDR